MPRSSHYAVLLAINYYPGLSDLAGPANDVEAFRQWLIDPEGGDLPEQNIKTIRSSDYPRVSDPLDANPNEIAFKKALNALVKVDKATWKDHAGERLYLYMAGHGFTAGSSIDDPALWSAAAGNGDAAYIAGYRYASKIVNAGFFDEVVLFMDCCQDVRKAIQIVDPGWDPPDRKDHEVKLLEAYGAPRGQAAYERDDGSGKKRGIFSKVLLEALRTAQPDEQGFVTGTTLKRQFLNLWKASYQADAGYTPPITPPRAEDIQLFARAPAASIANGRAPVRFVLQPAVQGDAVLQIVSGRGDVVSSTPAAGVQAQALLPGFYKAVLVGTSRSQLFEVDGSVGQEVTL